MNHKLTLTAFRRFGVKAWEWMGCCFARIDARSFGSSGAMPFGYCVYGLLPFCKQSVLMVLRCNCFRISGFLLGSALPEP